MRLKPAVASQTFHFLIEPPLGRWRKLQLFLARSHGRSQ
jgi:hypothetical protein